MDHVPAPGASSQTHHLGVLVGSNVPFAILFGIFVVALIVLIVITLMWAIRRDRSGRAAWRQRQVERGLGGEGDLPRPHPDEAAPVMAELDGDSWFDRLRTRLDVVGRRRGRYDPTPPDPKTAFVLAGGGSRGAVQVGMLAELVARGVRADRVFGASVGAINGGAYAGDPTPEGIDRMTEIWREVKGSDIFPRSALDGPWAFLQKRAAVHSNSGVRAIIEAGIDFENLQDSIIPLEVVTTSLTDGRERWIAHGNTVEAILASSAIPSLFPPVIIDGDVLVDGGVVNNVPISRAIAAGCTRIYVLLCGPLHYHPRPPKRPAEAALTAFFVAIHARFVRELVMLPPGVEVVVFSGGGEPAAQYRDFSATAQLIEEGRAEVAEVLDRYAGTSQDLTPHRPWVPPARPAGVPSDQDDRSDGSGGSSGSDQSDDSAVSSEVGAANGDGATPAPARSPAP